MVPALLVVLAATCPAAQPAAGPAETPMCVPTDIAEPAKLQRLPYSGLDGDELVTGGILVVNGVILVAAGKVLADAGRDPKRR